MSAWRRKASALFPNLHASLHRPDGTASQFLSELADAVCEVHQASGHATHGAPDVEFLRRAYGFGEWCLHHDGELRDAAGVAFYESLFAGATYDALVSWLSPFVVTALRHTWAVDAADWPRLLQRVSLETTHAHRTTVYATGEIEGL